MAVTIDSGAQATDDPLAADLALSMDRQVANQDVDTSQFSTMLMKMPVQQASSFKEEWLEIMGRCKTFFGRPTLWPFAA